jgi:ATP-binding cassette, subfamily C (CFTR/MRP), member 1
MSFIVDARVSVQRISKFLLQEELDPDSVIRTQDLYENAAEIIDGEFRWDDKSPSPTLKHIELSVPRGQLVGIVGGVGSGKSSLLSALLGEIPKVDGRVCVNGTVCYVAQQPWIQNATLKDNILFGKAYNETRYHLVLQVCELTPDIKMLPNGDMTEIGEKVLLIANIHA